MTTRKKVFNYLSDIRQDIPDKYPTTTAVELANTLGVSTGGVRVALRELVVEGAIDVIASRSGPGGGTSYRVLKDVCR